MGAQLASSEEPEMQAVLNHPALADKRKIINLTLYTIHAFAFAYVISALAAAGAVEVSKAFNFSIIWLAILTISFSIGGHLALTKYRTALAYGFIIGTSFMMSMQMLTTAVLAGSMADYSEVLQSGTDAERSVVAFASLLFIAYAVFTAELVMFKDTVIADDGGDPGLVEAGGNGTGAARFSATAGVSGGATGAPVSAEHDDRL